MASGRRARGERAAPGELVGTIVLAFDRRGAGLCQLRLNAPDTLYPGKGREIEGVANFRNGPPADFATRSAGRQEMEDATFPYLPPA